jgi:DNA repair exonuclease SbcCD ATPase subunit
MSLKYIVHVSDLHIRNGDENHCRYAEYKNVFNNLIISIKEKNLNKDEFVIIISGDVFHNKNNIGNYGLLLYKDLIENLTKLGKVIIFHGNHDKNQNELHQPSLVESSSFDIKNLILLNETTTFNIGNVGFSYLSIDDTLDNYKTTGISNRLHSFPIIENNDIKYKIGLFHGTFNNIRLYNGTNIDDEQKTYSFEMIKEFDFMILGDIHLRQQGIYKNKTLWAYSGSLIQQNFGEDIIDHGYLIWNLENKTIEEVNVYNDIGYVNLKEDEENNILIKYNNKNVYLKELIKHPYFPKNLEIRTHSEINYENLINLLKENNINNNLITNKLKTFNNYNYCYNEEILDITNKEYLLEYFKAYLNEKQFIKFNSIILNKENLLLNINKIPEELKEECCKRNKEISTSINNVTENIETTKKSHIFSIFFLEWNNIYCYEDTNWINFSNLTSKTFLIYGQNGTGKSAIYDIITLSLWGCITTSKQNDLTNGIINVNKNSGNTIVDIVVNNTKYRIERSFFKKSDSNALNKNSISLYKYIDNENIKLIAKDNACKNEILKLIGTMDNFLLSSMITQNIDFNILKLDYKECTSFIDKIMNIDYIYNLYNLFKLTLNKYKDFKRIIESKKQVYQKIVNKYDDIIEDNEFIKIKNNLEELYKNKKKLTEIFNSILFNHNEEIDDNNVENIITDEEYYIIKNKYNELKTLLKDVDIEKYYLQYDKNKEQEIQKPCENYMIENEKEELEKIHFDNNNLEELKILSNKYKEEIDKLIENKPLKNKEIIENNIYENIEDLFIYCKNNTRVNKNLTNNNISYDYYKTIAKDKENVINKLNLDKKNHEKINENFKILFENHNNLIKVNKPEQLPSQEIKKINIKKIEKENIKLSIILNKLYDDIDSIFKLNNNLNIFKNEYNILTTKEEYEFNSLCYVCCKKSWVLRINELNKIILDLEKEITKKENTVYNTNNDYISIYNKYESNTTLIKDYYLKLEWDNYNLYNNSLTNINNIIKEIEIIKKNIIENENILLSCNEIIYNFNIISFNLYDSYNYKEWLSKYEYYNNELLNINKNIDYIIRKNKLNDTIEKMEIFNTVNSYKYITYKNQLEAYKTNKKIYKKDLNNRILDIELEIKEKENIISKHLLSVKNSNCNNLSLEEFNNTINDINIIIEILEIIIEKFQEFRINLYKNYILKDLIEKSNTILSNLCHKNTKPFKLDFLITTFKDNIHINWLIHNIYDDNDKKQVISINQASGFQQFAISLALRISLYLNKKDIKSSHLFIDEGFTGFDKNNLSIVPFFIKKLLQYFNNIMIVSHIELIQDSVDETVSISYNKNNKKSSILYDNYIKVKKIK